MLGILPRQAFCHNAGFVYEYDVYLMIGHVDEIREEVYRLHRKG